jgi:hypothetical protein
MDKRTGIIYERECGEKSKKGEGMICIHKIGTLEEVNKAYRAFESQLKDVKSSTTRILNRELDALHAPKVNDDSQIKNFVIVETTNWKKKDKEWLNAKWEDGKHFFKEEKILKRVGNEKNKSKSSKSKLDPEK